MMLTNQIIKSISQSGLMNDAELTETVANDNDHQKKESVSFVF